MKLIREARMGLPKSAKSVAVVGTYPKPMLVFEFDEGGLDVIPTINKPGKDKMTLDISYGDIHFCEAKDLKELSELVPERLPKVTCVMLPNIQKLVTSAYMPTGSVASFDGFVSAVNLIATLSVCPWKTIVVDPLTGLADVILAHVAATNSSFLGSALKWAPAVGGKIYQIMGVTNTIKAHVVYILHCAIDKNEVSTEVLYMPLAPSQWFRDRIGALVSQFFFATKEGGKAMVYTSDQGLVKGIGCRWPANLASKVDADFTSIYGNELL